jgi:hypothetical protein
MSLQKDSQQTDLLGRPSCPNCGKPMWLARVEPDKAGCHRRTLECPVCLYEEGMVVNCGRPAGFDSLGMPSAMRAGIDQRTGFRSRSSKLVQYVGVVGFALAGIAFGLTAVVKAATGTAQQTQRERTLLDVRIESAREIRQALAKPIPHPTPLPPMTTRVTPAIGPTVAASKRDHAQLMDVARDAFANIEPVFFVPQPNAYAASDRHTVR